MRQETPHLTQVTPELKMQNMVIDAAGMVIFTRSAPQQFLLMKHSNRWDLPKGHAEPNESILETALRETEEETGIPRAQIEVDRQFTYQIEYPVKGAKRGNYLKRVTYFIGFIAEPADIHLSEHIGYQWFRWPVSEALQAKTIDPLLAEIANYFSTKT